MKSLLYPVDTMDEYLESCKNAGLRVKAIIEKDYEDAIIGVEFIIHTSNKLQEQKAKQIEDIFMRQYY